MTFDVWFNKQSRLIQVLLLLIPFVGWVVEFLVRLSILLKKKDTISLLALLVFAFFGAFWVLCVLDLVYLVLKGHLFLAE
ncbi:MAG: hypothetical protein MR270_06355 [Erysipelotrichaceae bacterium]|nr:hypothetical protein [Erysipelotrichaceae bacterium]